MTPLLLTLALLQAPADEGTFVVREDTIEVARETFRVHYGRLARGGIGWTLATTARYDRARPVIVLAPILEVRPDTMPTTLQFDVADPRQPSRILGELGRGRFTIRVLSRTVERAREFPATGATVVLDDSVFALYTFVAWRAASPPRALTAIVPRALRRETVQVADLGMGETTLQRAAVVLRHLTVSGGAQGPVHLWVDAAGRLVKVDIPERRVTAERVAGG